MGQYDIQRMPEKGPTPTRNHHKQHGETLKSLLGLSLQIHKRGLPLPHPKYY